MVDIDRGPDPRDLLAQLIAGQYGRAAELDALTDATHDRDAAITANYLVDPQLARALRVGRYADAVGSVLGPGMYPKTIRAVMDVADAEMAEVLSELVAKFARDAALGRAVKKAKGRGEVEVLIANLEADAHRTQHDQEGR